MNPFLLDLRQKSSRLGQAMPTGLQHASEAIGEIPGRVQTTIRRLKPPHPAWLILVVVATAATYFFVIGRNRYQVHSEFLVRQPLPPGMTTPTVVGPAIGGPAMFASLEDGRYLAVYLHSPEVMRRVFAQLLASGVYRRQGSDLLAGLPPQANSDQQLAFFRRQVQVLPQELSGVILMTTTGFDAPTSLKLNELLLREAQQFVNVMNQSISREQLRFAEEEVNRARTKLNVATTNLNQFQDRYGQLNPIQESEATSSFITALEAKLVDLKVEEASLKRQFKDVEAPEVAFISDQVRELEQQIAQERRQLVSPSGRDLNRRASEAMKLQNEIIFATEGLRAAMTAVENSRMESQRQLKFLVILSDPVAPAMQDWDWRWRGFLGSIGAVIVVWGVSNFVFGISRRT